jgi:hypothetical protein
MVSMATNALVRTARRPRSTATATFTLARTVTLVRTVITVPVDPTVANIVVDRAVPDQMVPGRAPIAVVITATATMINPGMMTVRRTRTERQIELG